jgi:outer membrane protein
LRPSSTISLVRAPLAAAGGALLTAALLLWPAQSQAQAVRLGAILEMARATDAQYAAVLAAAQAGRERLPQARAGLLPTVGLSWASRQNRDGSSSFSGTRGYEAGSAAITLNQPLFRLVNLTAVEQAEIQVRLVEVQVAQAEQDLLLRVARGYFEVLQAQDELLTAGAQKDALVQQLAQVKRSFEVGTVPITDLSETQARHDLALAQEIVARNELELRKRTLERSIARPLPVLARLAPGAAVDLLAPARQKELVDSAAAGALAPEIARLSAQVAEREVARREASRHPTLDLVASMSRNLNSNFGQFGGTDTRQVSVGLELAVPLYQGGAISSRMREAQAELRRAQEELTNAERQALLDAHQAQLSLQSGVALTEALAQAVRSSEAQLRSTQRGLQVGVRTRVDLLNAEQQLFATRKDLASSRYRTLLAGLQLKAAAGVLTESDLRLMDAMLVD